jgi:hypothetical protein
MPEFRRKGGIRQSNKVVNNEHRKTWKSSYTEYEVPSMRRWIKPVIHGKATNQVTRRVKHKAVG